MIGLVIVITEKIEIVKILIKTFGVILHNFYLISYI